jgi:hypothetical protein
MIVLLCTVSCVVCVVWRSIIDFGKLRAPVRFLRSEKATEGEEMIFGIGAYI